MAGRRPNKPAKPQRRDPDAVKIAQRIRAVRLAKGISQTTLGAGLGDTFQQVQKYERGTNRVSAGRLRRIAEMLDTPITFFYGEPAAGAKKHADNGFALLQSKGAIRLLRAYAEISSGATKHELVMLAEAVRAKN
jgi:transcriptional regulator with XRE-family HTH domain